MRRFLGAVAGLVLCSIPIVAGGARAPERDPGPLLIVGVDVIDTEAGRVIPDQVIAIEDGRIVGVFDEDVPRIAGAREIDAEGLYALPGLIDSHVHYAAPDVYGPMMIAYGVVMVRDMGGATGTILPLRDELNAGDRLGPRMIATGAIIDGNPPIWPFSEPVETPEQGRAAVGKLAEAGVDQIKIYNGLSREAYRAVCEEAHERGLMPVGHVPAAVEATEAIGAGQRTIEHLTGFGALISGAVDPDSRGARGILADARAWERMGELDDESLREMVRPFAEAGLTQCPTLTVYHGVASLASGEDEELDRYIPAQMRQFWDTAGYEQWARHARTQIPGLHRMVGIMHEQGVPIIAGTDLANPNVHAGHSLHTELALLVECGLSPAEAIRAATVAPAELFGLERLGTIKRGKEASLVLLEANPLEDIGATRSIHAVIHRGRHYDRAGLDGLLEQAAAAAASGTPTEDDPDRAFSLEEVDLPGRLVARGIFSMKFGEFDAGTERFVVTRDRDGLHLGAHVQPAGGMQQPFSLVLHATGEHRFSRATYRQLTPSGTSAEYELVGDALHAAAGEELVKFELPDESIIVGPAIVCDVATFDALDLEVGETVEREAVSFGQQTWRPASVPNTITRLENQRLDHPVVGETDARVYRQKLEIPGMGTLVVTTHVDARGLILRSGIEMPFGVFRAELTELKTEP